MLPIMPPWEILRKLICRQRHLKRSSAAPLAFGITGDVAGLTCYVTRRGKQVIYPASPALLAPTPAQQLQRACWACAMSDWKALRPPDRDAYNSCVTILHLMMHGVNLWLTFSLTPDTGVRATVSRQSGVALFPPVYYGYVPGQVSRYAWTRIRNYLALKAGTDSRWGFVPLDMPP